MAKKSLIYPLGYKALTNAQKKIICNGCGPKGWKNKFVPNTILFVSVLLACQIHDYMYFVGLTRKDKVDADNVFLKNMNIIFDNVRFPFSMLNKQRRRHAELYFFAVVYGGESSFLEGKHGFKKTP